MSYVEPAGAADPAAQGHAVVEQLRPFWAQFRRLRDPLGREELLIAYRFVADEVLAQLCPAGLGLNELAALERRATRGLAEAIERFPDDGDIQRFPEHAATRVRAAVTDGLERLDWLPRTLQRHVPADARLAGGPALRGTGAGSDVGPGAGGRSAPAGGSGCQNLSAPSSRPGGDGTPAWAGVRTQPPFAPGSDEARLEEERAPFRALARTVGLAHLDPVQAADPADQVRRAMRRMPEQQRTVLTLQFLAGLSLEQVGALLGTSVMGARRASEQALSGLRRAVEEDAGPLAAQAG